MEIITAKQASEAARGLTFEDVWAALMEDRQQQAESRWRMDELTRNVERASNTVTELTSKTKSSIDELTKKLGELTKRVDGTSASVAELTKNVGGINNSLGRFTESLFSTGLDGLFNEFGYTFTKQGPHVKFKIDGKVAAEADYFLEDGEYAMAVEVKTELRTRDVDDHIERIGVIRRYFDARGDKRVLVGAVAGGIVHENVLNYALRQGLYVVTQKGNSAVVVDLPPDFQTRKW